MEASNSKAGLTHVFTNASDLDYDELTNALCPNKDGSGYLDVRSRGNLILLYNDWLNPDGSFNHYYFSSTFQGTDTGIAPDGTELGTVELSQGKMVKVDFTEDDIIIEIDGANVRAFQDKKMILNNEVRLKTGLTQSLRHAITAPCLE